ncbi:MAG: ImmA/IrrE family metallo-endopeptidase [Bacilli bacterium]|nr:ImmA/IrrE family metallo-endopeptidase [Bacilli bacterium]MDD3422355.1 ImmA/IrrE family metallo-endopeptidase [Bacilli bacterium]MDD4066131.1 ImmA/IrrE family metallo-endopeptidase [Bacilli bacterium]
MRLTNSRYEEIKKEIANVIEDYNITSFPVNVFELANKMGIKIVYASSIIDKNPGKVDEYFFLRLPDAYLQIDKREGEIKMYVDNLGTRVSRQRFSIAHEIMHFILNHREQNEKNESEANFGATYMLAPTSVSLIPGAYDELYRDLSKISPFFGISLQTARITMRYVDNRIQYGPKYVLSYEKTINEHFEKEVKEKLKLD